MYPITYIDLAIGLVGCVALQNGGHQGLSVTSAIQLRSQLPWADGVYGGRSFTDRTSYRMKGRKAQTKKNNTKMANSYLQVDFSCMYTPEN